MSCSERIGLHDTLCRRIEGVGAARPMIMPLRHSEFERRKLYSSASIPRAGQSDRSDPPPPGNWRDRSRNALRRPSSRTG